MAGTMSVDDETRRRWKERERKLKFNSCEEAEQFWEADWAECPVCGAVPSMAYPLESDEYLIILHKDKNLLKQ